MFSRPTYKQTRELYKSTKRFYEVQRLHVYDKGGRNSISGIKATVFGGTSVLGLHVGSTLTQFGSV